MLTNRAWRPGRDDGHPAVGYPQPGGLLAAVALDIQAMTQHKQNPLGATAQAAADAGKEGGFLGFGAKQVSEGEQKMLDRLDEVLAG